MPNFSDVKPVAHHYINRVTPDIMYFDIQDEIEFFIIDQCWSHVLGEYVTNSLIPDLELVKSWTGVIIIWQGKHCPSHDASTALRKPHLSGCFLPELVSYSRNSHIQIPISVSSCIS
jgi:hypothetical protein